MNKKPNDPAAPPAPPSTMEVVGLGLSKRYRRERRFRMFGLAAIVGSLSFLVLLLGSIGMKGWTAFVQTRIHLDIHLDPARLDVQNLATANYNALGAFANLEWHPRDTATLRSGYRVDLRRFPTYAAMNQAQQTAFASGLVNLPSKTTFIAEVSVSAKHYEGVPSSVDMVATHTPASSWTETGGAGAGNGVGPGSGTGAGTGSGSGSMGALAGSLASLTFTPVTVPGTAPTNAQLVTGYVRVAQSLATRTSVIGEVSARETFGDVPPAIVTTPARFFDDGVYDDPFASDSRLGRVTLKSIGWRDVELSASASWQDKPYGATPALDATGSTVAGVLRHDHVTRAAASSTWPLAPSHTGRFAVNLIAGYDYTRHRSTTASYNYTSHAVSVGLGVGY